MKHPLALSFLLKFAFCLIFVGPIIGCSPVRITLLCLGDGFTAGSGATSYQSWPSLLQNRMSDKYKKVINSGLDGDTVRNAIYRVKDDIVQYQPDVLFIFLGTGDVLPLGSVAAANEQLPTLKSDLSKLMTSIANGVMEVQANVLYYQHYKMYKIYIINPFGTTKAEAAALHAALKRKGLFLQDDTESFHAMLMAHSKMLKEFAHARGFGFIDNIWHGILDVPANMSEDGIHPNAVGYKVMENNIFAQLKPYLKKLGLI